MRVYVCNTVWKTQIAVETTITEYTGLNFRYSLWND